MQLFPLSLSIGILAGIWTYVSITLWPAPLASFRRLGNLLLRWG